MLGSFYVVCLFVKKKSEDLIGKLKRKQTTVGETRKIDWGKTNLILQII